jgi:hypothetical protein
MEAMIPIFAAACLAFSDGHGNTTLTCPDGRSGYLYTTPGGATSGMLGAELYQPPTIDIRPLAQDGPQATYIAPPPATPPAPVVPPAPPPPELPSLNAGAQGGPLTGP